MRKKNLCSCVNSHNEKKKKEKGKKAYNRFVYSEECLKEAIEKIKNKTFSINKASKEYNIPKSTLINKLKNNVNTIGKMGPATVLNEAEEKLIVEWIIQKARIGCPMHPCVVKTAIKSVLDRAPRTNPFKNNMPGEKWFKLFLKRHPEVKLKNTEVLSKSRASVTEENIRQWFEELQDYLKRNNVSDILSDPSRIYNMDETAVQLCPKTGKLLGETKEKNNYYISPGQEKETITVLCSYGADGRTVCPMIVYPYKRFPPKDIAASVPEEYVIGHSPKGWMTADTFCEFIKNGFYKQLMKDRVKFPVLLLFDGHSSHMSLQLHNFCTENAIILYCLYPNATHILQPCDVTIFRPLKKSWQKKVAEHAQNSNATLTKRTFAPLFNKAFVEASDPSMIKKAFECCGLYPFNPDAPDYTKCISSRRKNMKIQKSAIEVQQDTENNNLCNNLLLNLELNIPQEILNVFKVAFEKNELPDSELVLFNIWKNLRSSVHDISVIEFENNLSNEPKADNTIATSIKNQDHRFQPITEVHINNQNFDNLSSENIATESINLISKEITADADSFQIHLDDSLVTQEEIYSKYSSEIITIDPIPNIYEDATVIDCCNLSVDAIVPNSFHINDHIGNASESTQKDDSEKNLENFNANTNEKLSLCAEPFIVLTQTQYSTNSNNNQKDQSYYTSQPNNIHEDEDKENVISKDQLSSLWKQELHFPTIKPTKRQAKSEKPKIFAITSQEWRNQENEKLKKKQEQEKLKELKKFEREMKKKIKQEECEIKKQERLKIKVQQESIKKESEAKMKILLKRKAETLNINDFESSVIKNKKK